MRFPDGVDAQPEVLARSAAAISAALPDIGPVQERAVIALVGVGASEHIARAAAPAWRASGLRTVAVPSAELMEAGAQVADVHVGLSESGRSAETVSALTTVDGRRLGVTNVADSPLAEVVDELLLLDSGPDSAVYTTGYTASLQAMGMLGEHWAGKESDWSELPAFASSVLTHSAAVVDAVADRFESARIIDVVAGPSGAATAGEGALILREAARAHTAAHETHGYLHGPMEPLDSGTACIIAGHGREVRLAEQVSRIGCPTLLLTTHESVEPAGDLVVLRLPAVSSPLALAVLEILPVQVLAWRLAAGRGLAVDGFRYQQDDTKLGDQ